MELVAVEFLEGAFHVLPGLELDDALVSPFVVSVGVADLAGPPHQVLQVLPGDLGRQVLDDDPVVGPPRRSVLLDPTASAIATVSFVADAASGSASVLDRHP